MSFFGNRSAPRASAKKVRRRQIGTPPPEVHPMLSAPGSFDERLLELVSDRVGVIKNLEFPTRGADEPFPPVICEATLSNFDFRRAEPAARGAAGKARP